jgi:hypothetical protein
VTLLAVQFRIVTTAAYRGSQLRHQPAVRREERGGVRHGDPVTPGADSPVRRGHDPFMPRSCMAREAGDPTTKMELVREGPAVFLRREQREISVATEADTVGDRQIGLERLGDLGARKRRCGGALRFSLRRTAAARRRHRHGGHGGQKNQQPQPPADQKKTGHSISNKV